MGWPWEVESTLDPWSMADATELSALAIALDCTTAALLVAVAGCAFQWWRCRHRRSLVRFRLRTLLIGVTLFSIACACLSAWQREWSCEQDEIADLPAGALKRAWPNYPYAWVPPKFLPESLSKAFGIGPYFNRITSLELSDDNMTDDSLRGLEALTCLDLTQNNRFDDSGIQPLARLGQLNSLVLDNSAISPKSLHALAEMQHLRDLWWYNMTAEQLAVLKLTGLAATLHVEDAFG